MQKELNQEDLNRILKEEIIPDFFKNFKPKEIKKAFILGGQPGSGKSTLARELLLRDNNLVFINGDDLRTYHPYYYSYLKENDMEAADKTQSVSNFWVESLLKETVKRNLSFIIEGTLRTVEVPMQTASFLKNEGYKTKLVVISTPKEISLESLKIRYKKAKEMNLPARYTKEEFHDNAYLKIENTLKELLELEIFDEFSVFLREKDFFKEFSFLEREKKEFLECFKKGRVCNDLSQELKKRK